MLLLRRCRQTSGKVIWLCQEHAKEMKVTVLAKDAVALQKKVANPQQPEFIAKWLRELNAQKLAHKFDSSQKVKKAYDRKYSSMFCKKFNGTRNCSVLPSYAFI